MHFFILLVLVFGNYRCSKVNGFAVIAIIQGSLDAIHCTGDCRFTSGGDVEMVTLNKKEESCNKSLIKKCTVLYF